MVRWYKWYKCETWRYIAILVTGLPLGEVCDNLHTMHCMQTSFSFLGFKLLKTCNKPQESPSQLGQTTGDPAAIFTAVALEKYSLYLRNTVDRI